ncbi:hypothetical protein [Candidatus Electronema sp. PJ]|uniref:RCC1 domain-containing protein n=1 Tax=Candidatus Electronema sp. PJ TaxID=3401572 RepID=UPI003AA8EEC5
MKAGTSVVATVFLFLLSVFWSEARATQVAAGYAHTVAIKADGTLWAWGENGSGQLGDGTAIDKVSPVQIGTLTDWKIVATGYAHTVAIKTDGTLWAWGDNSSGQLGDGTTTNRTSPVQIGLGTDWATVAAGGTAGLVGSHTVAIKTDGSLWAWGSNNAGRLGDGTTIDRNIPIQIGNDTDWRSVSAGGAHTVAIKTDGTVWAWGFNGSGQVGDGTTADRATPFQIDTAMDWETVTAGGAFTLALKTNGTLWAWGANSSGQLGDGTTVNRTSPIQIGSGTTWSDIAAGGSHSVALKAPGTIWTWGLNSYGQLGSGTTISRTSPGQVGTAATWSAIAAGGNHTGAVKSGFFWSWGDNSSGQLGLEAVAGTKTSPVQIGIDINWSSGAAGYCHSLVLKTNGTLWASGCNDYGQLGDGTTSDRATLAQINSANNWKAIAAGDYHTVAIKTDGTLWAWGNNGSGQLGDGTWTNRNAPVQIGTDTSWDFIAAGADSSFAIKDGELWAWGDNQYGKLGDGTTTSRNAPVQIGAATDWLTVATGGLHSAAIKTDGTFWTSGRNNYGQLGDGTWNSRTTFGQITGGSWQSVSAGTSHTIAIKTDGTLWAWGRNNNGQLGNGAGGGASQENPVQITGTWSVAAARDSYTVAIKTDGTLWAWGDNSYGQLGDGTTTKRISPVKVTGSNWSSAAAGTFHALAVKTGTLYAWGDNSSGQFGDGSAWRESPSTITFPANSWTITPVAENGSISPSSPQIVTNDDTATFTITPDYGYFLESVSGCGGSLSGNTYTTAAITANCAITATFSQIDLDGDGLGDLWETDYFGSLDAVNGTSDSDSDCYTDLQEYLNYVAGKTDPAGNPYVPIMANAPGGTGCPWTVTPSAGTGGTTDPSSVQKVEHGLTTSFTITPNTGYSIDTVSGCNGTLNGNTYTTGVITGDCTVTASFKLNSYTVTPSAGDNGTINPNTPQTVYYGSTTDFTITPSIGYSINTVEGCGGTLNGNTYTTGIITGDCTVTASFKLNTYTVTPSAGDNGTINPNTPQTVNHGATTSFTVTPNANYSIDTVSGCGGSLSGNTYTTGIITGDCTVTASFKLNTYTVTPLAGPNGEISPKDPQTVNHGSTTPFTITPDEEYSIDTVSGCGGSLNGNTYTTAPITNNCTVTALFRETDSDGDGIDDAWEEEYFGDLTTANALTDWDKDGYTDLQEYLNWLAGETDPKGAVYDPKVKNAPGGTGYEDNSYLQSVYKLLLN